MGKNAPQLESNPFYSARKAESEKNEELSSRESASDVVLIEQTRLSKIESGKVVPYPEEVCNMARGLQCARALQYILFGILRNRQRQS